MPDILNRLRDSHEYGAMEQKLRDDAFEIIQRLRGEKAHLIETVHYAHDQGCEWPSDPFANISIE